jgi:hypothetical protein
MAAQNDAAVDLKEIEKASRSGIYGSEEFKQSFVSVMRSREQQTEEMYSIENLITALCGRFGVTPEQLSSSEKTR